MAEDDNKPVEPTVRKPEGDEDGKAEMPFLGRRVVDMSTHKPKKKKQEKSNGPSSILTQDSGASDLGDSPGVRVQDGSLSDFEAMLAESAGAPAPTRVEIGDKIEGLVTSVGQKWIYVDLGEGREGVARTSDFVGDDGEPTLAAGARRDFFVLGLKEGTITLGDQLSTRESAMDAIETAAESGVPLNGRVADKNKGGFEIDLGGVMAFCPISQIELGFTDDPDVHLGRSYQFRVMEVREGGRSIVVSRAELLREQQARAAEKTLEQIQPGMVVDGEITRLADFGAFVDIGGVEGLVHISELGFSHIDHPSEVVKQGQTIKVKVLNMDRDDRGLRIGLSMKETMEDPWEAAMTQVYAGAKLSGTINRLEPFGAFVEVAPHVEGLVHVSEMSWEKHVKRPGDIVSVGQVVAVEVLDVDLPRRRISLSMKAAAGDPWSNVTERYAVGQEVTGTVENIEDFGVFVGLGNGITALLPRSEMGLSGSATPHAMFSRDDSVTARVLSIEAARRRMSLSLKSAEDVADDAGAGPRSYSDAGGSTGLGTLGDLLKDKLKE